MADKKTEKEKLQDRAVELGLKVQENDTVEQLKQAIAGAEAIARVAELEKQNKELNEHISASDKEKNGGAPTVKHGGKVYAMPIAESTVPKNMAKKLGFDAVQRTISRDEIKKSKELREKLIELGSGLLVEV